MLRKSEGPHFLRCKRAQQTCLSFSVACCCRTNAPFPPTADVSAMRAYSSGTTTVAHPIQAVAPPYPSTLPFAIPDPTLVCMPPGVGTCFVWRNVVTDAEEALLWEEWSHILKKDGEIQYGNPTSIEDKTVRNTYLEFVGNRPYTEQSNWKKGGEKQKVPGMAWSPTLIKWLAKHGDGFITPKAPSGKPPTERSPISEIVGEDRPLDEDGYPLLACDMGRVVEHNEPGYEPHTEHPAVGKCFLYLNLLSDTVLTFDDEASGRQGTVYLPQRSLMYCSGELRWGWRIGESVSAPKLYKKTPQDGSGDCGGAVGGEGVFRRTVEPDLRLSIQMWQYDPRLLDKRQLQLDMKKSVDEALSKRGVQSRDLVGGDNMEGSGPLRVTADAPIASKTRAAGIHAKPASADVALNPYDVVTAPSAEPVETAAPTNVTGMKMSVGKGLLGGDLSKDEGRIVDFSSAKNYKAPTMPNAPKAEEEKKPSYYGGSSAAAVPPRPPQTLGEVDKEFNRYKHDFNRITGLMSEIKQRENRGEKVDDSWLKNQMQFPEEGDQYGFDPENPEATWERIEEKAKAYRDRVMSMDYHGKDKKESAGGMLSSDSRVGKAVQSGALGDLHSELVIEGLDDAPLVPPSATDFHPARDSADGRFVTRAEDAQHGADRRKRDEQSDQTDYKPSSSQKVNTGKVDIRDAVKKLLPKHKADEILSQMPAGLGTNSTPFGGMGL